MAWNTERGIALGTDLFGFYFLPKFIGNMVAKTVATSRLDKAIADKCGAAGASNRDDLVKQLGTELSQKRWDVYRFPALPSKIPFLGGWRMPFWASLNIGTKWGAGWALGGDTALLLGYGLPENKHWSYLNYGFALGLPLLTQIPFIWDLKYFQDKGALPNALKVTSENIQCKNDGPSNGSKVGDEATATAADGVSDPSVSMMVSAAEAGGIPVNMDDLTDQVVKVYGSSTKGSQVPSVVSLKSGSVAAPKPISVPFALPPALPVLALPKAIPVTVGVRAPVAVAP